MDESSLSKDNNTLSLSANNRTLDCDTVAVFRKEGETYTVEPSGAKLLPFADRSITLANIPDDQGQTVLPFSRASLMLWQEAVPLAAARAVPNIRQRAWALPRVHDLYNLVQVSTTCPRSSEHLSTLVRRLGLCLWYAHVRHRMSCFHLLSERGSNAMIMWPRGVARLNLSPAIIWIRVYSGCRILAWWCRGSLGSRLSGEPAEDRNWPHVDTYRPWEALKCRYATFIDASVRCTIREWPLHLDCGMLNLSLKTLSPFQWFTFHAFL